MLRNYQSEAVDATFAYLRHNPGNPVISLPTGSGKSVVIAEIARRTVEQYGRRLLILQHRKELVEQNAEKVSKLLGGRPIGLHSAGLRRFSTEQDVILCGIQSVYQKANLFGARHLVLVDEVHLVPNEGDGMFRTFFDDLRTINPDMRVIGLTATPYRTGEGTICGKGALFQDVCYEAQIRKLIDDGYLCPLINDPSKKAEPDTSKLRIRGGEFILSDMQGLFSEANITHDAVRELVAMATGRHSVIVFCAGVSHANAVANLLRSLTGDRAEVICGETLALERGCFISDFREQKIRFLVNVDVLTTGFDAPCVDCVAILRATNSPGLYYQIVGRGLRMHDSKKDCLILDFGGNLRRHGPIDAIDFGNRAARKASEKTEGPKKECPGCLEEIPASKMLCECGFAFPKSEPKLDGNADNISQVISEPITFSVESIYYALHRKEGKPDSMRVDYTCNRDEGNISESLSEWVCLEHEGFARRKAVEWWKQRSLMPVPNTAEEAISLADRGYLAAPRNLIAIKQGAYWRITSIDLEEVPEATITDTEIAEYDLDEMPF